MEFFYGVIFALIVLVLAAVVFVEYQLLKENTEQQQDVRELKKRIRELEEKISTE
jgi:uncharacterized membrane protein (DUF106 family)